MYNVLDHGLVADNATDNRVALTSLIATVHAASGGTIFFPAGNYRFLREKASNQTIVLSGRTSIRFLGDGPASRLLWDGEMGGAGHFFKLELGTQHITFEQLYLAAGTEAKTDNAEQHHAILLDGDANNPVVTKNIEFIKVLCCNFGYVRGDGVNLRGGVASTACHGNIAATDPAGPVAGPFVQPLAPQRVCVNYKVESDEPLVVWDGGSFTILGTDINGVSISETISSDRSKTLSTVQEFATVTGATKNGTGTSSAHASIGYVYMVRNVWIEDCVFNGFDVSGGAPQTNGYRSAIACQRFSVNVHVHRNVMTGCGDQLIDFEATGPGGVGPWDISDNLIINANPRRGEGPPKTAVSFYGNSEVRDRNSQSRLSRNWIYGAVVGGKTERCDITDNIIVPVPNPAASAGISFSGTAEDINISRNRILGNATCLNSPIRIVVNNGFGGNGVRVCDNTIEWYGGAAGVFAEGISNLTMSGNRLVYLAATTNADNAIVATAKDPSNPMRRTLILDNVIEGDRGGGTLAIGIRVSPQSQTNGGMTIRGNRGTGVQDRGIEVGQGSYSVVPIVCENDFFGAATPVFLGNGVKIVTSGNIGDQHVLNLHPIGHAIINAAGGWTQQSSLGYLVSTASGYFYVGIPLKQGERITSLTFARYGNGSAKISSVICYHVASTGLVTNIGSTSNITPGASWVDTTLNVTDTVVGGGDSLYMEISANAAGIRIGSIRVTHDRPFV